MEAMENKNKNIDGLLKEAIEAYNYADYYFALIKFQKVLQHDPENTDAKGYIEKIEGELSSYEEKSAGEKTEIGVHPDMLHASGEASKLEKQVDHEISSAFDDLQFGLEEEATEVSDLKFDISTEEVPVKDAPIVSSIKSEPKNLGPSAKNAGGEKVSILDQAEALFDKKEFAACLEIVEPFLSKNPMDLKAKQFKDLCKSNLITAYESKIGPLDRIPKKKMSEKDIFSQNLDARAGFILGEVDGFTSYEDLIEISGIERYWMLKILVELLDKGVIGH